MDRGDLGLRFINRLAVIAHMGAKAHKHYLRNQHMVSARLEAAAYLVKAVTWLTVCTKAPCSSFWVGERALTEPTMMLQSLAVLPTKEKTADHDELQLAKKILGDDGELKYLSERALCNSTAKQAAARDCKERGRLRQLLCSV